MVVYKKLEDLQINLPKTIKKFNCIGVSINDKWYPTEIFTEKNVTNLNKKVLALLLTKKEK